MTDDPGRDQAVDDVLDGNAAAGRLARGVRRRHDGRPREVRALRCGARDRGVASLRASPGTVLRCPICDGIILRIVETDEATYVDARGAAYLRFERR